MFFLLSDALVIPSQEQLPMPIVYFPIGVVVANSIEDAKRKIDFENDRHSKLEEISEITKRVATPIRPTKM